MNQATGSGRKLDSDYSVISFRNKITRWHYAEKYDLLICNSLIRINMTRRRPRARPCRIRIDDERLLRVLTVIWTKRSPAWHAGRHGSKGWPNTRQGLLRLPKCIALPAPIVSDKSRVADRGVPRSRLAMLAGRPWFVFHGRGQQARAKTDNTLQSSVAACTPSTTTQRVPRLDLQHKVFGADACETSTGP